MNAITRLLLNVIVPCLPVNHNTASDINAPNSDLNGNQGGFVIVPGSNGIGTGNSQAIRHFLPAGKKSAKNAKTLLTPKGASPYKPVINEGGAPLAQTSSPL